MKVTRLVGNVLSLHVKISTIVGRGWFSNQACEVEVSICSEGGLFDNDAEIVSGGDGL